MRTERLTFGAISVPGGWRYSPAVLAQAVGTLEQMFSNRLFWIGPGRQRPVGLSVGP